MKICSFFNVKGGVGKTTLTALTAIKLSKESYTERKLSTADIFNDYLNQFEDINKDLLEKKLSDTTLIKNAILNKLDIEDYCKKMKRSHKVREEFSELIEELKEKDVL